MKYYLEKTKFIIIISVMFVAYFISDNVCYAESQSDNCYFIFHINEDNSIYVEFGKEQELFNNTSDRIDLTNLELIPQTMGIHYSYLAENAELETLTTELREYLLYHGYAKLTNEDIATDGEKRNQQNAKEKKLGIWELTLEEPGTDETSENSTEDGKTTQIKEFFSEQWKRLCSWIKEKKDMIISVLLKGGVLAFLARIIYSFLKTKKRILFFGGANSTGKSTLSMYLINPDASKEDLLHQSPTLRLKKERIVRDDMNRKLTLKARLLDTPGHELGYVIDKLSLTLFTRIFKKWYTVIIMVAPTKSYENRNEMDQQYIQDQLNTITKLWIAVFKAKRIIKPRSVILFINKMDLYDNKTKMISAFSEHKKELEKICKESKIPFEVISGSVLDKSGMTELMQIIKK